MAITDCLLHVGSTSGVKDNVAARRYAATEYNNLHQVEPCYCMIATCAWQEQR